MTLPLNMTTNTTTYKSLSAVAEFGILRIVELKIFISSEDSKLKFCNKCLVHTFLIRVFVHLMNVNIV